MAVADIWMLLLLFVQHTWTGGQQSLRGDLEQTQVSEDGCCQEKSGLTNISGAQPSCGTQVAVPIAY